MQSNAQVNDSNGSSGGSAFFIRPGETEERYAAMLSQALAQAKQKAEQAKASISAARKRSKAQEYLYREGCRQSTQRCKAVKLDEQSPATAYQQSIDKIETTLLPPAHDISLEATRLEDKPLFVWNPHDLLAEKLAQQTDGIDRSHMADLETIHGVPDELQCTPLPELSPRIQRRITIQLENEEPRVLHFVTGMLSAREMVETAISEYRKQYGIDPVVIRVSPSTLLRLDARTYWTTDDLTYYQSLCSGTFIVQIDITLDHMTVQCEEAIQTS